MKSIPPERKIELLGQLLSAEEGSRGASADRLKDIIEKELSAALRDPVPPDILGLYAEQQKTLGEFRSFLQRTRRREARSSHRRKLQQRQVDVPQHAPWRAEPAADRSAQDYRSSLISD